MRPPKHPRRPQVAEPVRISVRAKPRASRSQILRVNGLSADIALAAPPVDGAVNAELLALLSTTLSVSKSALHLVLGESSKHKVVAVTGLSTDEVTQRLLRAAPPDG
jgi:uncharacterized protein (TIGR00251 family)